MITAHFHKKLSRRILLDNSGYALANLGDTAMLQVAIKRILTQIPYAEIFVFTNSTSNLGIYCSGTREISPIIRDEWFQEKLLPIPEKMLPGRIRSWYRRRTKDFKFKYPRIANGLMSITKTLFAPQKNKNDEFLRIIESSDMVIASGGGYITDSFSSHAAQVLGTLLVAQRLGVPTAMFGQGIGPLQNKSLSYLAGKVLPNLKTLAVREGLESMTIAKKLNVSDNRIFLTGDDAIEIVQNTINQGVERNCIGVNIRLANYAGEIEPHLSEIANLIEQIANDEKSIIIPVPVHIGDSFRDLRAVTKMCQINKSEVENARNITTPALLVQQISRCRIVITGSYHAGVFALSQGIPVVALVGSDYYAAKFYGLINQFEGGGEIVNIESDNFIETLRNAIVKSLAFPEKEKAKLIEKAKEQSDLSKNVWKRFLCHEYDQ